MLPHQNEMAIMKSDKDGKEIKWKEFSLQTATKSRVHQIGITSKIRNGLRGVSTQNAKKDIR